MGVRESLWLCVSCCGRLWAALGVCESLWLCVSRCGCV